MATATDNATSLASALEAIERRHWDAYKRVDVDAHNIILTDDYVAISPDGTMRTGKPTAHEIAGTPIGAYSFQNFQAAAIAPAVTLVTFVAEVEVPGVANRVRFRVSELWIESRGQWMQRFYQGTLLK